MTSSLARHRVRTAVPHVQCLTFDLDNTLWDTREAISVANAAFFAELRRLAPDLGGSGGDGSTALEETFVATMRACYRESPSHGHDFTALRRLALERLARGSSYTMGYLEPAVEAFLVARNKPPLWPGIVDALRRLRDGLGVQLGAITNGNADALRIDGLRDVFSFEVRASDAGHAKPHPAPFELAVERSGVPADCIAHVGDDPATDVAGARAAGMRAVLVTSGTDDYGEWTGVNQQPQPQPDVIVLPSVCDLPQCEELLRWCGKGPDCSL